MKYRRVLLLTELGSEPQPIVGIVRRMAPAAELVIVVARLPERNLAWFSTEAPGDLKEAAESALESWRNATSGLAQRVDVQLEPDLIADDLAELVTAADIDLLVAGTLPLSEIAVVAELRKRWPLAVLWTAGTPFQDRPIAEIRCLAIGSRARAAVAVFLRNHGDPALHATVVLPAVLVSDDLAAILDVTGIEARVDAVTPTAIPDSDIDLLVLARFPGALLPIVRWPAPVLILPLAPAGPSALRRAIDLGDPVEDGGEIRVRIHYASGIGRNDPIPDQQVAFVSGGRVAAVFETEEGAGELPADVGDEALGVYRVSEGTSDDPVSNIEQHVTLVRPGSRALILFDSDLRDEELSLLAHLEAEKRAELLAVRMRPMRSCHSIRSRLRHAGLPPRVADASAVLDEGVALDVPSDVDPVRLARVGARMRAGGFPVVAIVHRGPHTPRTIGFASLRAEDLATTTFSLRTPERQPPSLARRLEATTGAALLDGNRVELELDNAKARLWLLDAIASARRRIHLQLYMALDDDVGAHVEAALAEAGARGVTVRVVVDSLHALEGSLGAHNPLLERLGARRGVELRVSRPVIGVPSLEDLKQRDHRKLAIVDGTLALVGGRNLSHEYYTGFEEVALTPQSSWREVPWLDAGARVEGPAVAALERSFLDAWSTAGGIAFPISEPPPAGTTSVRVVVHHGLRDACTLEAYLALIDTAKSHVYAVNGFPLLLEIQHALLRALRRGVRVCTLFGNLTPTHDGQPFKGPWSAARVEATSLVHSRMDALVAAGAAAHLFAVQQRPEWSPVLGVVRPHVHAKVMSVDGEVCSVGSANLDITAGYWESELLLLVEDPAIVRSLEAHIEQLIGGSERIDRSDPVWQQTAARRRWMRHWPGVLSV